MLRSKPPRVSEVKTQPSLINVPFDTAEEFVDISFNAYLFGIALLCPSCGARIDGEGALSVEQNGTCPKCQKETKAVLVEENMVDLL